MGISFDSPADNKAFKSEHDFPFDLLSDPDKKAAVDYQVLRDPDDPFADYPNRHSYLLGPDGTIEKVYDVGDPASHASQVIADLS